MVEKKKGKLWNRLFFKVYINYAFMVVLFAIILGVIFFNLNQKSTINSFRNRLEKQGEAVSSRYTEFIINKEYSRGLTYLDMLREIGAEETWSVANPNANEPMHTSMVYVEDIDYLMQSDVYKEVIEGAFAGKNTTSTSYSEIYRSDIITVGVPVFGNNQEVCGAILINAFVEKQTEAINSTTSLILVSSFIALLISFVVAIMFAGQLSRPILKMRHTALELADQNYEVKTGINRKDEIGDLARTIDLLTDKLMENETIRKNLEQMRMDFFANVSHELRTPITVVRAYTESLVDGVVASEEGKQQYYQKMLMECKSMERLVGDLLILSKMQNPDFVVEKEPVNLIQVFDDVVRAVKQLGDKKGITINLSYDNEVCLMYGDYDRLRQMFLIICDNAIKFSNENSTIHILIESEEQLIVSIRDEGIGIAKEELPNIFEKFYKSNLRQNEKGSGLGLAIARQIALKHNGTVEVESKLGVGTEFMFTFEKVKLEELEQ